MVSISKPSEPLPPVFILSTGRCGSTMISNVLNLHPRVLSLSEFYSSTGLAAFARKRMSGDRMWRAFSQQEPRNRLMLQGDFEERLYPLDSPGARFSRADVPPIMCTTLPHLTAEYEALYDEMEPMVKALPAKRPSDQYRDFFAWLCNRFGKAVWVERSGASLLFTSILLRHFPDAKVVHVYRDGRDVALSMSRHYLFRVIAATFASLRLGSLEILNLLGHDRLWNFLVTRMVPAISRLSQNRQLPFDKLELQHFGAFWSRMIEHGHSKFAALPPDALLNVRFEDVQANPEGEIRRLIRFISPELEDEAWVQRASQIPRPTASRFPDLPAEERDRLTAACRPGLELLGYPA